MFQRALLFILLFCYVFAFYIAGVSISLLICVPLYVFAFLKKDYFFEILNVVKSVYIKNVIIGWVLIINFSIIFPIIYQTWDLSFFQVIAVQMLHIFAAIPVFAYLKYRRYTYQQVEKYFVWIFVLQTLIQCIVLMSPSLGELILYFNKFDTKAVQGIGSNIRGKALSAATTYHLSLVYGVAFIIYIKEFLCKKISIKYVLIGLFVFVGIFFAGRTGFVGVLFGIIGFFLSKKVTLGKKICFIFYSIVTVGFCLFLLSILSPVFFKLLEEQILPYAFEFFYSIDFSGQMETASTNHLMRMWQEDFNEMEFLIGSGKYTTEAGGYYMGVDPGILRHLLFMGIIGYILLLCYQLVLLPIHKMSGDARFYYCLILCYWFVMDFKGCTMGSNKFAFAVSLLFSFSYFYLQHESKESHE